MRWLLSVTGVFFVVVGVVFCGGLWVFCFGFEYVIIKNVKVTEQLGLER